MGAALVAVVGTLLGAVVGGGITLIVERQRQSHEDRSFWRRELLATLVEAVALLNRMDLGDESYERFTARATEALTLQARLMVLGATDCATKIVKWGKLAAQVEERLSPERAQQLGDLATEFTLLARDEIGRV